MTPRERKKSPPKVDASPKVVDMLRRMGFTEREIRLILVTPNDKDLTKQS